MRISALLGDAGDIAGRGTLDLVGKKTDYHPLYPALYQRGVAVTFAVTPVTGIYVLAASTLLSPVIEGITRIKPSARSAGIPSGDRDRSGHGQLQKIPQITRRRCLDEVVAVQLNGQADWSLNRRQISEQLALLPSELLSLSGVVAGNFACLGTTADYQGIAESLGSGPIQQQLADWARQWGDLAGGRFLADPGQR